MYDKLAEDIIFNIGGQDNIKSLAHCVTRLRFKLKDDDLAKIDTLKKIDGITTVIKSGGQVQVVIGNHVPEVYKVVSKKAGLLNEINNNEIENDEKGSILDKFIDVVSGVFTPALGVLAATGMIKGMLALLSTLGLIKAGTGTYEMLNAIGDSFLYFFPIFLGYTAAKKFNSNIFIGMTIGASLVYPTISTLNKGEALFILFKDSFIESPIHITFLGIPVILMSYASSVIPIILAVIFSSKIEKLYGKIIPSVVKVFLLPFFTLLTVIPATFIVIGPVATWAGQFLGFITSSVYSLSPTLAGAFIGGFWQVIVIFGLHWGLIPIMINNIVALGADPVIATFFGASFAQTGAVLAILLKTKDKKLKALTIPAFISGIFGVTEPAIYGITLPRKKPFIISCLGGALAGGIMGFFNSNIYMFGGMGIFGIPTYINPKGQGLDAGFWAAVIGGVVIAFIFGFIVTYLFGFKDEKVEEQEELVINSFKGEKGIIYSPMKGILKNLKETTDEAFASGALGKGVVIIPEDGRVVAPISGIVSTFFPTGHAIAIEGHDGTEILIHVGIDTVQLNGKYFYPKVEQDSKVEAGDLLLEFDIEGIKKAGYSIMTPIIISNSDDYKDVVAIEKDNIDYKEELLKLSI